MEGAMGQEDYQSIRKIPCAHGFPLHKIHKVVIQDATPKPNRAICAE